METVYLHYNRRPELRNLSILVGRKSDYGLLPHGRRAKCHVPAAALSGSACQCAVGNCI